MIEVFIMETCPYCKKVVDYLKENSIKHIEKEISIPDNLNKLISLGGKDQVPFLYNPQDGTKLYESDLIINYLKNRKG